MPGCFLYNSTEVPVTLVANAAGVATNSYTINIDPTLVGQNLYNQALVFDNPNTTTNALELRLGLK